MSKSFLSYLLSKPEIYLKVWCWIWSKTDENKEFAIKNTEFKIYFHLPKTTLHRIIKDGAKWTDGETSVECEWNNKELKIKFLDKSSGTKVEQKRNVVKKKETENKEKNKIFAPMLEVYNEFCLTRTGVGAKLDALQGKSMTSICSFLKTQVKAKNSDLTDDEIDQNVLLSWQIILDNWVNISEFYQNQVKLNQINSNLPNILSELKNKKITKRNEKFANSYRQVELLDFE